jgi:hypothetical protein
MMMLATQNNSTPIAVYIAGESRSGSTVLDIALSSIPGCISVGEIRRIQGYARRDHDLGGVYDKESPIRCTCGEYVDHCEFWQSVEREAGLSLTDTPFKSRANLNIHRLVQAIYLASGPSGVRQFSRLIEGVRAELKIAENCFRLYGAITRLTGCKIIIDSSKNIYHYVLIRSAFEGRVKLITLVRDGRAVAYSQVRGNRYKFWPKNGISPYSQAATHWVQVNHSMRWFTRNTPPQEKYSLRYEDFCADPKGKLQAICSQFGLPLPPAEITLSLKDKHGIGGSPGKFTSITNGISLDESWRKEVSVADLHNFERIGGRLNRRLGYSDNVTGDSKP